MNGELDRMLTRLLAWLESLRNGDHEGLHSDCADCERYKLLEQAYAAIYDLRKMTEQETSE